MKPQQLAARLRELAAKIERCPVDCDAYAAEVCDGAASVQVAWDSFHRFFTRAESSSQSGWQHLRATHDGVSWMTCRRVEPESEEIDLTPAGCDESELALKLWPEGESHAS